MKFLQINYYKGMESAKTARETECEKTDENIVELLSYQLAPQLADYPCRIFIEYIHSNGNYKRNEYKLKQVYSRFEM